MKKTYELVGANFTVNESDNMITVTSNKPFKMIKGNKSVDAVCNEGKYVMSASGLIVNNTLPFDIEVIKESTTTFFPLLSTLISEAEQRKATLIRTNVFPFESLKVGDKFKLDGVSYVKESVNSYTKDRKFVKTGTPTIVEGTLDVMVENRYNILSPEQIRNIVAHMPKGLDEDDMYDEIHNILDDVAGFEMEEDRDSAIDAIAAAYMQDNQHSEV